MEGGREGGTAQVNLVPDSSCIKMKQGKSNRFYFHVGEPGSEISIATFLCTTYVSPVSLSMAWTEAISLS